MFLNHKAHFLAYYLKVTQSPHAPRIQEMIDYIEQYYSNVSIQKAMALILCNQRNMTVSEADALVESHFIAYKKSFLKYALTACNSPLMVRYKDIYKHIETKYQGTTDGWNAVFQKELQQTAQPTQQWLEYTYLAFTENTNPVSLQQKRTQTSKPFLKSLLYSVLVLVLIGLGYGGYLYFYPSTPKDIYYCISESGVKLRQEPNPKATDLGSLTYGTAVTLEQIDSTLLWTQVHTTDQKTGFIAMYYYLLSAPDFEQLERLIPKTSKEGMALPSPVKYALVQYIKQHPEPQYHLLLDQKFFYTSTAEQIVFPNKLKVNANYALILQSDTYAVVIKIKCLSTGKLETTLDQTLKQGAYFKADGSIAQP